ncbi:hypothetical protein AMTRI_Chr09g21770 [Amborella trichopoda]
MWVLFSLLFFSLLWCSLSLSIYFWSITLSPNTYPFFTLSRATYFVQALLVLSTFSRLSINGRYQLLVYLPKKICLSPNTFILFFWVIKRFCKRLC